MPRADHLANTRSNRCSHSTTAQHRDHLILAPIIRGQKGEYKDLFESLRRQGYARARVDGQVVLLSDPPQLGRQLRHNIEVVISRISTATASQSVIADAVQEALRVGENTLIVTEWQEGAAPEESTESTRTSRSSGRKARAAQSDLVMSSEYACAQCSTSFAPPSPQLLSFNSPQGMCPTCEGLGRSYTFAPHLLVPDPSKSIRKGAIESLGVWNDFSRWQRNHFLAVAEILEKDHGLETGASLALPWSTLPEAVQHAWLHGLGDRHITIVWRGGAKPLKFGATFPGIIHQLLEQYRGQSSNIGRKRFEKYMETRACDECHGQRLNAQARSIQLVGPRLSNSNSDIALKTKGKPASSRVKPGSDTTSKPEDMQWLSLPEICDLPIDRALQFLRGLQLNEIELKIASEALREITSRLQFLLDVGLDYLSLNRPAPSLSGGEAQRIRLASQIGAGLVGVLYVLDEPSIGLHPRDNDRLIGSLKALRDQGNSLIVVEHDEDTMRAADLILDFGPGPGVRGGQLVAQGKLEDLAANDESLTGQFLSGRSIMPVPESRRSGTGQALRIVGATHNNLKNVDVEIPLGKLVCITGVSGSGKSSLIGDILVPVLRRQLHAAEDVPGAHTAVEGIEHLDKMIDIDQSPIGRTPRSNPATYVKVFDEIRNIYADLPESKRRGYAPGRFSFNIAGGRCEACEGNGSNKLEMDFLADLWITCSVCEGRRYNHETLQVLFKGKSIAEVLNMDVQQALELFENVPRVREKLQTLHDVGLDYIKLGQPSPTLSGGEAQRVKLAKELSRRDTGRTLYLLDEPTTGLHFHDIRLLLKVLQDLVSRGNSVLVIEHNLDVIQAADWIVDLGPEGGAAGGELIFAGTPEEIIKDARSHTGASLAKHLKVARVSTQRKPPSRAKRASTSEIVKNPILKIQGAMQHNLRGVSLEVPHNTLNVFCGPSGSGKSSLAMDTIYAEGQRRYVESLSSYARQFVGQMPKPPVERVEGLAPAIAIEQKSVAHNPRSTVGTVTEIYDYLRVLMARLGTPHCPDCDIPVATQTAQEIAATIMKHEPGTKLVLAAPLAWQPNQAPVDLWQELKTAGLQRVRLAGKIYSLDAPPRLAINAANDLQVVIDRVVVSPENRGRIAESVELALSRGQGIMLAIEAVDSLPETDWPVVRHSQHLACRQCGLSLEPLTPHSFSFNTPLGWCTSCEGLGTQAGIDPNLMVDFGKTLTSGGLRSFPSGASGIAFEMLMAFAKAHGIAQDQPLEKLTGNQRRALFHGTGDRWYRIETGTSAALQFQWKGLLPTLEQASHVSYQLRTDLRPYAADVACSECDGSRLQRGPAAVKFRGLTTGDIVQQSLGTLHQTLKSWELNSREQQIAGEVLAQIIARIEFLLDVGLEYLSLSRAANTLSGGESQRIRLASQLGSGLCGVMYVLDEPTIGLHPRDNHRLLSALTKLRDLGNTLIVVEHDREVIAGSDQLYDFGPGAGRFGGRLVANGTPEKIAKSKTSVTGPFLSGKASIPIPSNRRSPTHGAIRLRGARAHTLRDVDVDFPLNTLTVITGPSGSGKSTLVNDILYPALQRGAASVGTYRKLDGFSTQTGKIIRVDQSPLGQNPNSTPATYSGVFDLIRTLYAQLPLSKARGFTARQFSFNVPGGRCEKCEGFGQLRIEMHFLPDVWVECDSCHGKRFTEDTLSVKYHGFSIHDVLEMQIGKALEVFGNVPKIRRILQTLVDVGLDYVSLGQSAPTLSGGEAQRVKLATELARPSTGNTLYLLDEPTTGLHFSDVAKLLTVLHRLVDLGNTVLVIEHNLDVIKSADWVIDMGPEAGWGGGQLVAAGTPEQLVKHAMLERSKANQQLALTRVEPVNSNGITSTTKKKAATKKATSRSKKSLPIEPQPVETQPDEIQQIESQPSQPIESSNSANQTLDGAQTSLLRSHTGEALAAVLDQGPYRPREKFDLNAYLRPQEDDLDLDKIGQDAQAPWQEDGRTWHTSTSTDRKGGQIRWDREILIRIADMITTRPSFAPIQWNDRSVVEVTGPIRSRGWFLHAITADTWLLTLKFRVPRSKYTKKSLLEVISLPTLNQVEEIEAYSNDPRVFASVVGEWIELEIKAFSMKELDGSQFWNWLPTAMDAFLQHVSDGAPLDMNDHMPWTNMGQAWHALSNGFPNASKPRWNPSTVNVLVEALFELAPEGVWDWAHATCAHFNLPGVPTPAITLETKNPNALSICLYSHGQDEPENVDALQSPDASTVRLDVVSAEELTEDLFKLLGDYLSTVQQKWKVAN